LITPGSEHHEKRTQQLHQVIAFRHTSKQHGIEEGQADKMSKANDEAALAALKDGAQTAAQVAQATGLTNPQAQAAIHHLESTGKAEAEGTTGSGNTASTTYKPTSS
jgi:predicted Rossmann fold nucleotide-binding protein DprA/Smf involved in DNA uptake